MEDKKLESLAYRLVDLDSLRSLFAHLNYNFADEPANKDAWTDDERNIIQEARVIAKKDDYKVYYLQTNTDSQKYWKGISAKIIKENHGMCLICSHNPSGFKWVFSSLSKDFSKSFNETRHIPIDIRPETGAPKTFVDFLEKIRVSTEDSTTTILAKMSNAFDSFAIQIHNELTVNVFEALKTLSEGIIYDQSNNLSLSNETLEEIREHIFILLYRIIFILYAEDRGIFPIEDKIYRDEFSLKWIKEEWLLKSNPKKLAEYQVQKRLKHLFRLIEVGSEELDYKKEEFFMHSYYGRIFDRKINNKLEEWNLPNSNLLEAISLVTRNRDNNGNYYFLDYSALETRHLGSIYEHLLEFHLHVKNKKIEELPNPNDRKSSGSYYTPQYVVDYIVQNTVEPLIKKIQDETEDKLEQVEKILSLNILDPAMGSGHFLIGVVNYIASRICEIENNEVLEHNLIERKRDVARRCVYGVDLNSLAVDLATVSLWLETLSSDKPLSFLSAHLKNGNSLIGTNIDVLFNKQTTLMESQQGREQFKRNIKDFIMFENLEDDSASAVKIKIEKYQKIQSKGTIYYNIKSLLDCKVAESFGLDIPVISDFKAKIGENSLDFFTDESWQKIQNFSSNTKFFHWDLEFPDIFYDSEGKKIQNSGFDAIIGNPPYISIEALSKMNRNIVDFLEKKFSDIAKGHWDLYMIFIRQAFYLLKKNGFVSFIVPTTLSKEKYGINLRKLIIENFSLLTLIDFGSENIFKKVARQYNIFLINSKENKENVTKIIKFQENKFKETSSINQKDFLNFYNFTFRTDLTKADMNFKEKIFHDSIFLGNICCINPGVAAQSGIHSQKKFKKDDVIYKKYSKGFKKYIEGKTISRYNIAWDGKYIDYENNRKFFHRAKFPELFENNKIIIRVISSEKNRMVVTYDGEQYYTNHTCNHLILWTNEIEKLQPVQKKLNVIKKHDFSLMYLTGILGSKLISYYFSKFISTGTLQGTYSAINPEELRGFPIKNCLKQKKEAMVILVKTLLKLNQDESENKISEKNIKDIDNQIDELVYDIYNISKEEQFMINQYFLNNALVEQPFQ